jgi:hypothetical protein
VRNLWEAEPSFNAPKMRNVMKTLLIALGLTAVADDVQNLSQCAGRPAMSSRCKSDTMKE